ncbi:hypothetical protein GW17_00023311 [Ensete ventricosum]|uniref:Uncharacterized protein n=2 Tax=Ensete ventricosum TaxID=4639 RepID=A0A444ERF1_ENSVE|nr:hypothetical protein GW17_00023311 [Ensete ventricosum]RZR73570.1 hypothetical protein BHM03_00025816 [Ensete ventricosum]
MGGQASCPQVAPLWLSPLYELATGAAPMAWPLASVAPYGLAALAAYDCPCRGLAVAGRPCRGLGYGRPPPFLATFAVKMQQERVERFYAIQSHHTQFKTNLSHKNLGSDTTIRKP